MPPRGVSLFTPRHLIQARPTTHPRTLSVCANDPSRSDSPAGKLHAAIVNASHRRLPQHPHSALFRSGHQAFVQQRPAQPDSLPIREICAHPHVLLRKTNASKSKSLRRTELHSQRPQRCERLGHHPFTTWFFNRRRRAVGQRNFKSLLARRNCCSQSRWSPAHNKYVRTLSRTDHSAAFLNPQCPTLASWAPLNLC